MNIISRSEWGAQAPKGTTAMPVPAPFTYIHHTVTPSTPDLASQKPLIRQLQQDAFAEGYQDIEYSFLLFNDGTVFEGRGWGIVGGHTENHNSDGHGLAAVGNYMTVVPSDELIAAFRELIAVGKARGKIAGGAKVLGHRDTKATACPGDKLYAQLDEIREDDMAFEEYIAGEKAYRQKHQESGDPGPAPEGKPEHFKAGWRAARFAAMNPTQVGQSIEAHGHTLTDIPHGHPYSGTTGAPVEG